MAHVASSFVTDVDTYCEFMCVRVVAANPREATVEQADDERLGNHLLVKHASALYAGAFAAARALVLAALAEHRPGASCELTSSELSYRRIPQGVVTSRATPAGAGWELLTGDDPLELHTAVASVGDDGKVALELSAAWRVSA